MEPLKIYLLMSLSCMLGFFWGVILTATKDKDGKD